MALATWSATVAALRLSSSSSARVDARSEVIKGPPGFGKTRLAEEMGARAVGQGAGFAIGACWPDGEAPPLWPWRAILRELDAAESVLEERGEAPADRFSRFQAAL